jgi:uncharacterized membrane protein YwzB
MLSLDIYLASYITDKIVYKQLFKYYFTSQQRVVLLFLPVIACSFVPAFIISYIRSKTVRVRQRTVIEAEKKLTV